MPRYFILHQRDVLEVWSDPMEMTRVSTQSWRGWYRFRSRSRVAGFKALLLVNYIQGGFKSRV